MQVKWLAMCVKGYNATHCQGVRRGDSQRFELRMMTHAGQQSGDSAHHLELRRVSKREYECAAVAYRALYMDRAAWGAVQV